MAARCESCGREFEPPKSGHVFCSNACRYRGRVQPELRVDLDQAAIDRLFDPARDLSETVRRDDWHPTPASGYFELDLCDTVAHRRRWFENLISSRR